MKLRKFLKDDEGSVLPLVAIILSLLALGFMALVIDVGIMYIDRKSMITAADAGALAGAQILRDSEGANVSEAELTAKNYAIANGADEDLIQVFIGYKEVTLPNGTLENRQVVEVTAIKNQGLLFAKFLGKDETNVAANAIATWGYDKKAYIGSFIPLFTFDTDYKLNTNTFLHERIGGSNSYGFIDIAAGMGDIKEAIAGEKVGGTYIYNNCLDGKPGNGEAVEGAVVDRMKMAQGKPTAKERKNAMIGLVPIIDYEEFRKPEMGNFKLDSNGNILIDDKGNMQLNSKLKLPINYFAFFEITDVIKQGAMVGSEEALDPNKEYTRRGIPKFDYSDSISQNLLNKNCTGADNTIVLGKFTGEIVNAKTIVEVNDQVNPNPTGDTPALYSKLIK